MSSESSKLQAVLASNVQKVLEFFNEQDRTTVTIEVGKPSAEFWQLTLESPSWLAKTYNILLTEQQNTGFELHELMVVYMDFTGQHEFDN